MTIKQPAMVFASFRVCVQQQEYISFPVELDESL